MRVHSLAAATLSVFTLLALPVWAAEDAGSTDATVVQDTVAASDAALATDTTGTADVPPAADATASSDAVSTDLTTADVSPIDGGGAAFNENPCWDTKCAAQTNACKADADCKKLVGCLLAKDQACVTKYAATAGGKLYTAVQDCGYKACNDPTKGTCQGQCGKFLGNSAPCNCDTACKQYGDCCADYDKLCGAASGPSCKGQCGKFLGDKSTCQCDAECEGAGDCCKDYMAECKPSGTCKGTDCKGKGVGTCDCDPGCVQKGTCCPDQATICGASACTADCAGKMCGDDDGCKGKCKGACANGGVCTPSGCVGGTGAPDAGAGADLGGAAGADGGAAAGADGAAAGGDGGVGATGSDSGAADSATGGVGDAGATDAGTKLGGSPPVATNPPVQSSSCTAAPTSQREGVWLALLAVGLALAFRRFRAAA